MSEGVSVLCKHCFKRLYINKGLLTSDVVKVMMIMKIETMTIVVILMVMMLLDYFDE